MILKILAPKMLAISTQITAINLGGKRDPNTVFEKTVNFFDKDWRKSREKT
jgi:hypothetical protein